MAGDIADYESGPARYDIRLYDLAARGFAYLAHLVAAGREDAGLWSITVEKGRRYRYSRWRIYIEPSLWRRAHPIQLQRQLRSGLDADVQMVLKLRHDVFGHLDSNDRPSDQDGACLQRETALLACCGGHVSFPEANLRWPMPSERLSTNR